jgi:hypothetical protein
MGFISKLFFLALFGALLFFGSIFAASELGGEVIKLRTFKENGLASETSLWIVEDHGSLYIRAGMPDSKWLARIEDADRVQVVRNGAEKDYRPVIITRLQDRVNRLMAEKYGWAEKLMGLTRSIEQTIPIRLDPI